MRFFNHYGLAVRSYEQHGHNYSGSKRGDMPHSATLFSDAKVMLDDLTRQQTLQHPESPLIVPLLFSHRMGGLVEPQGSQLFFDALRPGIGVLHNYDGIYQKLFNEIVSERVFAYLRS